MATSVKMESKPVSALLYSKSPKVIDAIQERQPSRYNPKGQRDGYTPGSTVEFEIMTDQLRTPPRQHSTLSWMSRQRTLFLTQSTSLNASVFSTMTCSWSRCWTQMHGLTLCSPTPHHPTGLMRRVKCFWDSRTRSMSMAPRHPSCHRWYCEWQSLVCNSSWFGFGLLSHEKLSTVDG